MTIRTKRIYEPSASEDGQRILVDRLWPRGVSKERADVAYWARDVAPSNELRKWYGHDHERWDEFKERYAAELGANAEAVDELVGAMGKSRIVTFVFSSKEEDLNNARALKEYLEARR